MGNYEWPPTLDAQVRGGPYCLSDSFDNVLSQLSGNKPKVAYVVVIVVLNCCIFEQLPNETHYSAKARF